MQHRKTAAGTAAHPYFKSGQYPRVLAHRGLVTAALAEQGVVENTRAAFAAAAAAGVHAIESDCHLTADGVAVLVHDPDLQRVAGDPRLVRELTCAQLREIMAPYGGLLTVSEALQEFPEQRFQFDVKVPEAAAAVGRALAGAGDRVMLTSFSDRRRKRAFAAAAAAEGSEWVVLPAQAPGKTMLLVLWATLHGGMLTWPLLRRILRRFEALQIPERYYGLRVFSPRLVHAAASCGVEVHVWTVNDPERMRGLVAAGAAGIITDRADVALVTLGVAAAGSPAV